MKTLKTWLPIFPGFYNTSYDIFETEAEYILGDDFENQYIQELSYQHVWDCLDYEQAQIDISKECCESLQDILKEHGIECKIEFESLNSPREYNFANDSIDISIELDPKKLLEYCTQNKAKFSEHLKTKYTSCSGFISSYSNQLSVWLDLETIQGAHHLGSVLEFFLRNEADVKGEDIDDKLREDTLEWADIYPSNYIQDDKLKEKIGFELETYIFNGQELVLMATETEDNVLLLLKDSNIIDENINAYTADIDFPCITISSIAENKQILELRRA